MDLHFAKIASALQSCDRIDCILLLTIKVIMQNSPIHLRLFVVVVLSGLVLGCGRPAEPTRPAAEIRAEVLPKIIGKWVLDPDATLEATASLGDPVLTAQIPTATMDLDFGRSLTFTCKQIMGGNEAKYIGDVTLDDATNIVLKQTHRIEPPIIPGALETSVPEKDQLNGKLQDGKLHLTHRQGYTNVSYILMRPKAEEEE